MPYSSLILTAGISAFTPRNALGKRFREPGSPLTFPPGKQNPEPANPSWASDKLSAACAEWAGTLLNHASVLADSEISAEYSMLHAINTHGKGLSHGALVHLVHTPTLAGRLAVELQSAILESRLRVQCHPVELTVPFDPAQPGGLALSSGAFIGQVSSLLAHSDSYTTAFAPIGGYKSMVALGHVAASFHGFPSLYLHEDSQTLQEIAPAPIGIAKEVRLQAGGVARKVGNGAEWKSLTRAEQECIDQHPAFFRRLEDLVELNELGHFLRLDSMPIWLDPAAEEERKADASVIDSQIRQIATLATADPAQPRLNHSLVSAKGRSHPWRLAQMGNGIRIAWQLTEDALLIGKIWRDHDEYEKTASVWIQRPLPHSTKDMIPFA